MVAADTSEEMEADSGKWSVVPASVGFLLGIGFLLALDELTPHLHVGSDTPEGPRFPAVTNGDADIGCDHPQPA